MFDIKLYDKKINEALEHFVQELKSIRTGRAHPGQLDGVRVEAYGEILPLNQVANITAPEGQLLQVTPFDPANLNQIVTAIRNNSDLGLNPSDDGRVIRVPIPPLTEERRRLIVKQVAEKLEDTKIAVRNIRQEAIKELRQQKDNKELSEDEEKRFIKEVDNLVADYNRKLEDIFKSKEREILTI